MTAKRYTVKQFAELMGWNEESVRQMCRKQIDKRTGEKSALPKHYSAERQGSNWWIYKKKAVLLSEHAQAMLNKESSSQDPTLDLSKWLELPAEELEQLEEKALQDLLSIWMARANLSARHKCNAKRFWDSPIADAWEFILSNEDNRKLMKRKDSPPGLKSGFRLLEALSKCYRFAVVQNKAVEVTLTFTGSGGWKLEPKKPTDEPVFLDDCFHSMKKWLNLRFFVHELRSLNKGEKRKQFLGESLNCLACGKEFEKNRRSQSKYCQQCQLAVPRFIQDLRKQRASVQGERIAKRLGLLKAAESE